jgi:hypothetical protein
VARSDRVAPDGTVTTGGLAIRIYRQGEGTIIRDAGSVRHARFDPAISDRSVVTEL